MRLAPKQEGNGGSARRVTLQGFQDGAARSGNAVLLQQFHQLRRLSAGRFAESEGRIEKAFALWHSLLQTAGRRVVDRLAA